MRKRYAIIVAAAIFFSGHQAHALHPYSITIVNADLRDEKVVLTIKTNAEDLLYFHKLEFDSLFKIPGGLLRDAARSHIATIMSGFYIVDQAKERLQGTMTFTNLASLDGLTGFDVMSLFKYPL